MPVESALIVLIPEAEGLVDGFRVQYDPSVALGVPAHVTVLYPFKALHEITKEVIASLETLFARVPGFTAVFTEWRHFPDLLYLAPEPAALFRHLTEVVAAAFPETPPYGGQFTTIIPHLTVAHAASPQELEEITSRFERAAKDHLPIQSGIREVCLMENSGGRWQICMRFALGVG